MKTLSCKDIEPSGTCDYKTTGSTDEKVLQNMMAHAKEVHAGNLVGVTDEQMVEMMKPHIKEEETAM